MLNSICSEKQLQRLNDVTLDAKILDIQQAIYPLENWKQKNIDSYITFLSRSESWAEAGKWAKEIQNANELTNTQIEQIGKIVTENDQVAASWAARPILRKILQERNTGLSEATRINLESISYV